MHCTLQPSYLRLFRNICTYMYIYIYKYTNVIRYQHLHLYVLHSSFSNPPYLSKENISRYIYTWNPNDHCFEWKGPSFGGFNPQNRGQTGSRYLYLNIIHQIKTLPPVEPPPFPRGFGAFFFKVPS